MTDSDKVELKQHTKLFFNGLDRQPADALLGLIGLFRSDVRSAKVDLGVGVYRNADGITPVFASVKKAEKIIIESQSTKAYLGPEGDPGFVELLGEIVFGKALNTHHSLTGIQTPGGTGALRLAADLFSRGSGDVTIWIGDPTWPNHQPIFEAAGLQLRTHPMFDTATGEIDFSSMLQSLKQAKRGDVVLLHGCCHNPTGADFSTSESQSILKFCAERGLIPLIDLAYQGLGHGLAEDAAFTRLALQAVPEAIVAYSCDKNFGLYRERVGALWIKAATKSDADLAQGNLLSIARGMWSMPPDHGAAVVRIILESETLAHNWARELESMRMRLTELRQRFSSLLPSLSAIGRQHGMFTTLPVQAKGVIALREKHAIFMANSGRMNIAGLNEGNIERVAAAIALYLD